MSSSSSADLRTMHTMPPGVRSPRRSRALRARTGRRPHDISLDTSESSSMNCTELPMRRAPCETQTWSFHLPNTCPRQHAAP
jgi:hypothetical protein